MNRLCRHLMLFVALALPVGALAQATTFVPEKQPLALLPAEPRGLSFVDGQLYLSSGGILFRAQRMGDDIVGFHLDTLYATLDDGIDYLVRRPATDELYYTRVDRKGNTTLHVVDLGDRRRRSRRVKLGDHTVLHPTFSADGRIMVFASTARHHSYGATDLWYSTLDADGRWSEPLNLGSRVNSPADDVDPVVVGDKLYFCSNGRSEAQDRMAICVTQLIADQPTGDTVGMLQIGRSPVQLMPFPLDADSRAFAVDVDRQCAYWYRAGQGVVRYSGTLRFVHVWGHVYDRDNHPVDAVAVTGQGLAVHTDADGLFRVVFPAGARRALRFQRPGYFIVDTVALDAQCDIVLDAMPVGRAFSLSDLFGPDAVIDLSSHGLEQLAPLARFLADNPHLHAELTLRCDLTDSPHFNALLTEQRLRAIVDYFDERHIHVTTVNGCAGRDGCDTATGTDTLSVLLK